MQIFGGGGGVLKGLLTTKADYSTGHTTNNRPLGGAIHIKPHEKQRPHYAAASVIAEQSSGAVIVLINSKQQYLPCAYDKTSLK